MIEVSVVIKALNEEEKISRCLNSVISEIADLEAEVILVDSLSSDNTVEIAKKYPVKIVQFFEKEDVGCGAAAELGYQCTRGGFVYFIDGDMECVPGFLKEAIEFLKTNDRVAGVGGVLVDSQVNTAADRRRGQIYRIRNQVVDVKSLGGGGLYRRVAIDEVGYFAHLGLKACEEAELGVRLVRKGWRLSRLNRPSVIHTGHTESDTELLKRIVRNGRLAAHGQFVKSSIGKGWFFQTIKTEWFLFMPVLINILVLALVIALHRIVSMSVYIDFACFLLSWLVVVVTLAIRKGSVRDGVLSVVTWHLVFVFTLYAFFLPMRDPCEAIRHKRIL